MIHLDRILFPTDGSECAELARTHALFLADRFEAALHVVHVDQREVELSDVIDIQEADIMEDLHGPVDESDEVAEPRICEREMVHPSVPDGILSYAAEHDVSLIVIGTHGRGGVRRLVLGSVAEEVVRRAHQPVMTVGRGARPATSIQGGDLLVPVDLSEQQERLVEHARELALAYDMTLTLLHVVEEEQIPGVYGSYASPPEPGVLSERVRRVLEKEAGTLRDVGVEARVDVRNGHAANETLAAAEDLEADLLAIATHGRSGVERMLMGSVAEKVIRRAPCAVFTVKSFGTSLVREEGQANDDS